MSFRNEPLGRASSEGPEMTAAYRDDLAYIHDAGFGGFARAAGPVLVDALRRARHHATGW